MELKVIPVVQLFIAVLLMTLIQHFMPLFNYSDIIKPIIKIAMILLFLFSGLLIGFLAIYSFKKHQTTVNPIKPDTSSKVVDSGIYQYSRNPMYLAMLLSLFAYTSYLANPVAFLICGLFTWYIGKYQITPEERILEKRFGKVYCDYKKQVRRWI